MRSATSHTGTLTLMIVSHSHWDREWHLPYQQFRLKLGKMIDSLLSILASSPDYCCFMLDGQTVLLEDYAELRPERLEELRAHIRSGRILVGPWYVLPDEFLVSGEAIIRNLLIGRDVANAFGGCMDVGYLPDQFGHIAQMPQILSSFGIGSAVLWRGVDSDAVESTEFTWRAPDGSDVLAINIPDGYFNAGGLPTNAEELMGRVDSIIGRLALRANTRYLLLMNGGDHVWPQSSLPTIVSTINSRHSGLEAKHSSLPAYVRAVERTLAEKGVQTEVVTGELRCCKNAHLLSGVLSTRMWIKQRNSACENLLEKWVEPFTAWAWIEASREPRTHDNGSRPARRQDTGRQHAVSWKMPLQLAWKYLLQNQPHDSICGCSIDQVHEEMRHRYDWVEQIGEMLLEEALQEISERIDTASIGLANTAATHTPAAGDRARCLIVYNPTARLRTDLVTFEADASDADLLAVDADGGGTSCQVLEDLGNGKIKLGFVARDVPGIGYKTYRLQPQAQSPLSVHPPGASVQIENEFYVVTVNEADGTIDVLDRATGQLYRGLNRFSDVGDAGDEYNFDRPVEDGPPIGPTSPPEVELLEIGPARSSLQVRSTLRIPVQLNADRKSRSPEQVDCPIATVVSLYPGVKRIDFVTRVENLSKDHRLRVLFPTGVHAEHFHTETQFDVLRRDVRTVCPQPQWVEDPVAAQPQKSFLDISDGSRGLLIANRGLPECEVSTEQDGLTVGLTLLRCVGWLSRCDLHSRRGDAGPELPTPGAQCLGTHDFHYAIVPHSGNWEVPSLHAHEFNNALRSFATGVHVGHLPAQMSFLSITPSWIPVSAIKPAHDASALVVRLYNPTTRPVGVQLHSYVPFSKAEIVNSAEQSASAENTGERSDICELLREDERTSHRPGNTDLLHLELQPKRIASVKLYYW